MAIEFIEKKTKGGNTVKFNEHTYCRISLDDVFIHINNLAVEIRIKEEISSDIILVLVFLR